MAAWRAYRYTEAKMSRVAGELLRDLEKETVDFRPNYDNTRKERFGRFQQPKTTTFSVGRHTRLLPP